MQKKLALVTGGNRGIGFEVARTLAKSDCRVIITARNAEEGQKATEAIHQEGGDVVFQLLDVTREDQIESVKAYIQKEWGTLDVLVNNAGVFLDSFPGSAFESSADTVLRSFTANSLAPFLMCRAMLPFMIKQDYGRIVNVSSKMGSLSEMGAGAPGYRMSKTALNAVTRIFSEETKGKDILINSAHPGWVKTRMGGAGAQRTIAEGADTIVWLATLPKGGPTGGFFSGRQPLAW